MSELDRIRPGYDLEEERRRLVDRHARASACRDLWWLIVKDARGFEKAGLGRAVRWARAGLGFDDTVLRPEGS